MDNQIINVAIHDLLKGEDGFRVKIGNDHLVVTPTTQRVVDELYELYSRRASKSHGKFSTADDVAPTERHLRDYLDQASDFADLTDKMMATLRHQPVPVMIMRLRWSCRMVRIACAWWR